MPQVANRELMDVVEDLLDRNTNEISNLSELSRAMSEVDPRQKPESWRRSLRRWRKHDASEDDIQVVATAFNVPRARFPAAVAKVPRGDAKRRLQELEGEHEGVRLVLQAVLGALAANGIQVPLPQEAAGFLASLESTDQTP